jgi:hypothetical protein
VHAISHSSVSRNVPATLVAAGEQPELFAEEIRAGHTEHRTCTRLLSQIRNSKVE